MKRILVLYTLAAASLLAGCNIYRTYQRPEVDTSSLYRDPDSATGHLTPTDTLTLGDLPWPEVFTDPQLQALIVRALEQNTDLQTAYLNVKQAEAQLLSARLAYAPAVTLAPEGQVSHVESTRRTWTWSAPVTASWEIDIFGKTLNAKRAAKASWLQSEAYRRAVQTRLIASVANTYYTLLVLDRQLEITLSTADVWRESVETMRAMKEAGMVNEAAIVQSEANYRMILASIPDLRTSIRETENALSLVLHEAPHAIPRGRLDGQRLPEVLDVGVPALMLSNRPDVRAAEMALATAFYGTNQARANFYPGLSLTGSFGWTNSLGSQIVNPGKMIAAAVGSLVAPIFARGANTARLRVAKAQQEQALLSFEQSLLQAGSEVSDALYQYRSAKEKIVQRTEQIAALEKSVDYTSELLRYGTSTYLEVLTARQSLLNAQLTGIADEFQRMQSVVNLYAALGGGRDAELPAQESVKNDHK